jgi:phage tail sheath protein FI
MPVAPQVSYPGVYIQEVESPVHTIAPVPTATTAFIGRALRGPVNEPVLIHSFGDFQRLFGGLWTESQLGYAISDFFLNGGSDAVIVRLFNPQNGNKAVLKLPADSDSTLDLEAKDEGSWGNKLLARVEQIPAMIPVKAKPNQRQANPVLQQVRDQLGLTAESNDVFTLIIRDDATGTTEVFPNITVVESPRRIDRVLKYESNLVRLKDGWKESPPQPTPHADPVEGKTIWTDDNAHTAVIEEDQVDDGDNLESAQFEGNEEEKKGIYALEKADIFNLLVIPPYTSSNDVDPNVLSKALAYCVKRRALLLVDPPKSWTSKDTAKEGFPIQDLAPSENAVVYFPRVLKANPLRQNQIEEFAPGGIVAGVMARTDRQRGVWKAPAGLGATLAGVNALSVQLTDAENGELNPLGINCLRQMPAAGYVVWGARTTVGDDRLASQWKYIPVRRLALFIEESLYRGTHWAVFEPNDEPLWSQLRLNIGVFMHGLFRQGAFQGQSPKDAYFVKCDSTTTTQADIDRGIVNIVVGFAPLKPAEFVVLYIQQMAGQLAV